MKKKTAHGMMPKNAPITLNANAICEMPNMSPGRSIMADLSKAISEKNKAFSKMTKMEKRVALAKDVIASIKSKHYIAENGTYLDVVKKKNLDYLHSYDLETIKRSDVSCHVCAIGSLFVSTMKKKKNGKLDDVDSDEMIHAMKGIFTHSEMRLLEEIFEGGSNQDANIFYERYAADDSKGRLLGIMKNIVKNNGNFKYKNILI
jgi:hypothetical protein